VSGHCSQDFNIGGVSGNIPKSAQKIFFKWASKIKIGGGGSGIDYHYITHPLNISPVPPIYGIQIRVELWHTNSQRDVKVTTLVISSSLLL
jgi:hypothetical protein